jgi:Tfp pilus assembly protein FimV
MLGRRGFLAALASLAVAPFVPKPPAPRRFGGIPIKNAELLTYLEAKRDRILGPQVREAATLADIAERLDPAGTCAQMAEALAKATPQVDDIPWLPSGVARR